MAFHKSICFSMAFFFIIFISSSHAYTFQVGGKDGWTLHPSESYSNWSSRLRFLINDTLHFKYDARSDSVLVVNKSGYDGCNASNPITKLDGGDSMFKFNQSGPFYFITGNKSNCDQGQKLIVVVLALRKWWSPPSVATPPTQPPSPAVSPVHSPSISPISSPSGGPASSPGEDADSPSEDDASSGGSADTPSGGSAPSPSKSPPPSVSTPPPAPSTAAPPLSGTIIASLVTMMLALWGLN